MNDVVNFAKNSSTLLILTASQRSGGNIYTGPIMEVKEVELVVRPKSILRCEKKGRGLSFVMKWFIQIDLPPKKVFSGIRPLEKIQINERRMRRQQFNLCCPFHGCKSFNDEHQIVIQTGLHGETWSLINGDSAKKIEEALITASDLRFP